MGEEDDHAPAVILPPKTTASIRFLGLLKQPEFGNITARPALELDERDVIWPSDPFEPDAGSEPDPDSESDLVSHRERVCTNPASGFGLSAIFAEDRHGMALRRPTRSIAGRIGPGPDAMAKSAPVNVPAWHARSRRRPARQFDDLEEEEDGGGGAGEEEEDDDGVMEPPHVIVAKSHVTTFSVFEGVGRTLKGRDLRRVRNAVFQQTGFLD